MNKMRVRIGVLVAVLVGLAIVTGAVMAGGGPQPLYLITDELHVEKDTGAWDYADATANADDHGCDDQWAKFYAFEFGIPTGVWSSNVIEQLHITLHDGLDGYYECDSGSGYCTSYLCAKTAASSVKVTW